MSITSKVIDKFHSLLDEVIKLQEECKDLKRDVEILDTNSRQIFVEAVEILRGTGMGDFEISELTREYLRKRIPERSLRKYLEELKPEETTEESQNNDTDENGNAENDGNNDTEQEQETPPEIAVTIKGSQTSTPVEPPTEQKETPHEEPTTEDPKEAEIAYWKERAEHFEDALHKTEQFKPATEIVNLHPTKEEPLTDEIVFQWLEKKDNGVNCHWYPNYGIDLFKSRILTQLKSKGVTTFKRLYFEV